ncbi:hypothetical protein DFJ58DRAFT_890284 [Suillus subalutaceus]|uniref:uncharacterized protein n=1 Tax=Suillus subalutaceus TaxID=48586 RepID=UPI001B86B447|nr:uncharacterized protein DFJ58DRAFT_890284 [Suillus subalutaceus]KAG1871720.1 hypothetical protein DFJ58DRAFT_890284 [Suillus subalutaceus]
MLELAARDRSLANGRNGLEAARATVCCILADILKSFMYDLASVKETLTSTAGYKYFILESLVGKLTPGENTGRRESIEGWMGNRDRHFKFHRLLSYLTKLTPTSAAQLRTSAPLTRTNAATIIPKPRWSNLDEAKQDQQRDSGLTKRFKRKRINITLPPPQRNRQMYGYYVSEKWLYDTARSFLAELHPDFSETMARTNAHADPSYSFQKTFHIHSLSTSLAILPPGQIVPVECMEDDAVCVLYIFSDQPDSYHQRPTQKQVDELTKFMGREPQWWVDVMPPKFYR